MYIKQISVYLENDRGTLREMTKLLAEYDIDMLALTLADSASFGIARLIVRGDSLEKVHSCLETAGFMTKISDVICVCVPNRPAALDHVLAVFEESDLAVEYMYSLNYSVEDHALLVLRLSDNEKGVLLLEQAGIKLCGQKEIDRLQ